MSESKEIGTEKILDSFFEQEINFRLNEEHQKYIVAFNIGTYGSI